jgi:DNA polymerase I
MWKFYQKYWLPFGEVLTDLEREGIKVNLDHMREIREMATHDLKKKEEFFLNFLYSFQNGKNIDHFNPASTLQLQQLLFAPCELQVQTKEKAKQMKD